MVLCGPSTSHLGLIQMSNVVVLDRVHSGFGLRAHVGVEHEHLLLF